MKKPQEQTVESFCRLALAEVERCGLGDLKSAARHLHVSPSVMGLIYNHNIGAPVNDAPHIVKRYQVGRAGSIVRICTGLDLDIESCLLACGLPVDERLIERAQPDPSRFCITLDDLPGLEVLIKAIGPIGFDDLETFIPRIRANRVSKT